MLDRHVKLRGGRIAYGVRRVLRFDPLDRYADMRCTWDCFLFFGERRTPYVVMAAVATAGSVMVSYARRGQESLIPLCKVGFRGRRAAGVLTYRPDLFDRWDGVVGSRGVGPRSL